jgi:hypothetical protein
VAGRVGHLSFVIVAGDLEAERFAENSFEGGDVTVRGPQFELRVAGGAEAGQVVIAARVQVDAGERLGVAAVEAFGEPHHR